MYINLLSFFKTYKYPLLYAACGPAICAALIFIARTCPDLAQLYASYIFPIFPNTLGRLLSFFPFSVFEVSLYLLSVGVLFTLFAALISLLHKSGRHWLLLRTPKIMVTALCLCTTILLMITLTCSINYSRDGIAKDMGIVTGPASHDNLVSLCLLLIDDVNSLTPERDMSMTALHKKTKKSMEALGKKYPSLNGYYPNPKPVIMSSWMSDIGLTGIFSPYTIEANYNKDVPDYIKPYTICHELSHLQGYIGEDDAGFIAYLACANSESEELRYSGAMNALSFVLNALYEDSTEEEYQRILSKIPERATADLKRNQQYWQKHQGTASRISTAVNDTYLKANAQSDGIQSYGRMVDLLLAYYGLNSHAI
mgnify:CR=1 FL=1